MPKNSKSDFVTVYETKRLVLSELNAKDAPFMLELLNTSSWIKYIGDRKIKTIKQAENYIKKNYAKDYRKGIGLYCVRLKRSNIPIGTCGLIDRGTLKYLDIGFVLLDEYAGNSYVVEAGEYILRQARELLLVKKVCAITVEYNARSIKTLERLGFKKKKKIRLEGDDEELLYYEN